MGFLDSIGTVLGGFNDVKQIDKDGFDFREKRRQEEFNRQREQELVGQQNEDRSVNQVADVLAGADDGQEPDVSPLLAGIDQSRRSFMLDRARGVGKERKSYLKAQDRLIQGDKDLASMARVEEGGRIRADLLKQAEEIRRDQTLSPREKDLMAGRLEAQAKAIEATNARFAAGQAGADRRAAMGTVRLLPGQNGLVAGAYLSRPGPQGQVQMVDVPEGMEGMRTTAAPATVQENISRGTSGLATIKSVTDLYRQARDKGEEWTGPKAALAYDMKAGWAGYLPGVGPPTAERALFSSQVAGLQNEGINLRTGAQMSEHEVPRLMRELPTLNDHGSVFEAKLAVSRYRFDLMDKVRRGQMTKDQAIQYMEAVGPETFLAQIQQVGGAPRAPRPPAGGGEPPQPPVGDKYKVGDTVNTPTGRVRFKGGDWRKKANWEPVR